MRFLRFCLSLLVLFLGARNAASQFTIQGDYPDLTLTTFAEGLNFPVGLAELPDGSILVGLSNGSTFYSATSGRLVRLVDADDDGVAETQQTLADNVPGASPTAVAVADDLVFVTGQGQPIVVYRLGPSLEAPLVQMGQIVIDYGGPWQHKHSTLLARTMPAEANVVELYVQIGSKENFAPTTDTASLTSDFGLVGTMAGDALYRLLVTDDGTTLTAFGLEQIATGLRNATGLAFHPETGDLYIADNGIDGLEDATESFSADELNVIPAAQVGGAIEDFGFPDTYVTYRTGEIVGNTGLLPLVAFQPIPDPQTGAESEGPNALAFAPPSFGADLSGGLFVGFHGQFGSGGVQNEENPLVLVRPADATYSHFVGVNEAGVGHLDGLLSRGADLFVADLATNGRLDGSGVDRGAIYRIRYTGFISTDEHAADASAARFVAYPNPFHDTASLSLSVLAPQRVRIVAYDVLGREIAVLHEGMAAPETPLRLRFGRALPNGLYVVQAEGERFRVTRRVVRVR